MAVVLGIFKVLLKFRRQNLLRLGYKFYVPIQGRIIRLEESSFAHPHLLVSLMKILFLLSQEPSMETCLTTVDTLNMRGQVATMLLITSSYCISFIVHKPVNYDATARIYIRDLTGIHLKKQIKRLTIPQHNSPQQECIQKIKCQPSESPQWKCLTL